MDANKLMSLMKQKKAALKTKEKTLKPTPGSSRYVLLPGWRKGEEHVWFHEFGQHYIKNAAKEIQAVYPCSDKTYGKPCAICEGLNKAMRMTADDETVELLKEANAGQSFLFNVLALDGDSPNEPAILEVRKSVFGQIVDLIEDWGGKLFDPDEPQIITINRDGKGLNTKYSVQVSPKTYPLPKGVLSKLHNLDEYVAQESEEQQRRALAAINSVAGLLPPPTSADKPKTAPAALSYDDDDAALTALEERERAQASKPSADSVKLDDELDDILGELETGT
ncbi:hypothetical protein N5B55_04705 [Ralstonia pickettii]|uniref:hypothetical protein n=1 Tax=Ralstonia pickettii TaxID=329 RepID=UPI002714BB51|nr:hypothetical protein [Ralstonia pickettii]WKZ86253.1 hypothetical protein N5B55_04705 [Ralstonia pickettii]